MMKSQTFSATIQKIGARTVVPLPFNPNEAWGARERHHITGAVNGIAIRGQLIAECERYLLPLGPAWLRDSGLAPAAQVEVVLSPEGPQPDLLPEDISAALRSDDQARAFFEALPTFYRKNFMRSIESAKRPETRAARIAEMMALLKAGRRAK